MKAKLLLLSVVLVALAVGGSLARAASVTTCPPGTTDRSYCETVQFPTATVKFLKNVTILKTRTGMIIDTGGKVICLGNLPVNCGGSVIITANLPNAARVVTIAHAGWHVKSGGQLWIRVKVVKKYVKLVAKIKRVTLVIRINHHGSVSGKKATLTRSARINFADAIG